MAVGNNNIYPPIVTSFAPCFVIGSDKGCRVYFSISAYNSMEEYEDVHISITRQSDNVTALNRVLYPSQIMIQPKAAILIDSERKSNDKYYITIKNEDTGEKSLGFLGKELSQIKKQWQETANYSLGKCDRTQQAQ